MTEKIRPEINPAPLAPSNLHNLGDKTNLESSKPAARSAATANVQAPGGDTFELGGSSAAPKELQATVQSLLKQRLDAVKLTLTPEDFAYIATTFAEILEQYPDAKRQKRAKWFIRILLLKKLRKLFVGAAPAKIEQMFEDIAEQIEVSPHFAQLVDEITESARKLLVKDGT